MKVIRVTASLLIVLVIGFSAVYIVGATDNDCKNSWGFSSSLEFEPGYWTPGDHNYEMKIDAGPISPFYVYNEFKVTDSENQLKGQVQFRFNGLRSIDGYITQIHPSQDTVMQFAWKGDEGESRDEIVDIQSQTIVQFRWDGGDWVTVYPGPVTSFCALDNPGKFMRSWGNPKK